MVILQPLNKFLFDILVGTSDMYFYCIDEISFLFGFVYDLFEQI